MQNGASAVIVGNFQITQEDALPWLRDRLAAGRGAFALTSRELMGWALANLHPTTLANTVNIPFSHNSHTNRLFWRVDSSTIIGRFYLMHMLCVRPEVTDFVIGSSCDYSFVPEMCPSGNVEAIADSDEYLVIEMQPRLHEAAFLRPGPLKSRQLAKSLSEWTTSVHRDNARHSLIFHADPLPAGIAQSVETSDAFIADVAHHLRNLPKPYRGHPYWHGAMAAFYDATGRKLDDVEWRYALGLPASRDWLTEWLLYRAKFALMGRPPNVMPWHPAWPDYQVALGELQLFFNNPKFRLLMLSNEPTAFTLALADGGERVRRFRCHPFLSSPPQRYAPLHGSFDLCLLELSESDMTEGGKLVDRIIPLMKGGGRIIVFVTNRRREDEENEFSLSVVFQSSRFIRPGVLPAELHFVPASRARWDARRGMFSLRVLMNKGGVLSVPLVAIGGAFCLFLSFIGNLDSFRRTRRVAPKGYTSSFIMRLIVDSPKASLAAAGVALRKRKEPMATEPTLLRPERDIKMPKTKYDRCFQLRDTIGLGSLGLLSNQLWYDDPHKFGAMLSRYQFIAKLLARSADVAEVGAGDAFGTRFVVREVADVTVYGSDPDLVEDIRARQDERWPLKGEIHDIVAKPLPRRHNAIFCLDLLDQTDTAELGRCLANLCASLTNNGVLIIGAICRPDTSLETVAAEVERMDVRELRPFLENYFDRVLMFSMIDNAVQPGLSSIADYVFGVCTEPNAEAGLTEGAELLDFGRYRPKREKSTLFEICEWKFGKGYFVRVTRPNTEPQRIDGFATTGDAARWIAEQAIDSVHPGRRNKE
jgi:hypothetical protein